MGVFVSLSVLIILCSICIYFRFKEQGLIRPMFETPAQQKANYKKVCKDLDVGIKRLNETATKLKSMRQQKGNQNNV